MAMARHGDPNPFEEKEEVNPFSDPAVRAQVSGQSNYSGGSFYTTHTGGASAATSKLSHIPSAPTEFTHEHDVTVDIPFGTKKDMKKKEKELEAWEKRLIKKEQELKEREERLARFSRRFAFQEKNWPSFFPIIHNDISRDMPPHVQRLMYTAFASFLGMVLCLLWNLLAVTVAWIKGYHVKIWLLAVIYALTGCPGAYFLWYRPLYWAMSTNSGLRFGWFFLLYLLHIGVCIFASLAPSIVFKGNTWTGILPALEIFSENTLVGIFYLIGFGLFCVESLLSLWVLQQVYSYFRGSGEARHNATRGAMNASLQNK